MSAYGFNDFRYTFDNLPWLYNFPHRKGYLSDLYWYGHTFVIFVYIGIMGGAIWYYHGFMHFVPMFWTIVFGVGHGFMWFINVNHWNILNEHTDNENLMDEPWAV